MKKQALKNAGQCYYATTQRGCYKSKSFCVFFWYFCVTVLYFVLVCFRIYIEADKIAKLDGTEVYTISQHWKVYASAQNFPVLCQQRIPQEKPIVVIS